MDKVSVFFIVVVARVYTGYAPVVAKRDSIRATEGPKRHKDDMMITMIEVMM